MANAPTVSAIVICLTLLAALPAQAQVASLGKGWKFGTVGSVTSAPDEVISGRNSVKGSYSGSDDYTEILMSDPGFIRFLPDQTYTITFAYRVLSPLTLQVGFFSPIGSRNQQYLNNPIFPLRGSGTTSVTVKLGPEPDYDVQFKIKGTGALTIDDIRVTLNGSQLVASENAEGPSVVPGPLNLQITDAITIRPPGPAPDAFLRSAFARDLDGDGYPEAVIGLTDPHNSSTTPVPVLVVQGNGQMRVATSSFFPAGIPTVKHSPMTVFADLNSDGLEDIIWSEAGGDPFGAGRISVALNLGGGKYRDVSNLVPDDQQNTRAYSVVVGDVQSNGRTVIMLPDSDNGANTALLRWNGDGFDEIRDWVPQSIWKGFADLRLNSWMNLADFDGDGIQDLLVGGTLGSPTLRIAFGSRGGFSAAGLVTLPDGPWGHTPGGLTPASQGAEVQPVVAADFNNDGRVDIFAAERKISFQNNAFQFSDDTFQVFINQGSRGFTDVTAGNYVNLGDRTYFTLLPVDINNDGFLDIVGLYEEMLPGTFEPVFATTFFLNDGTGRFQPVDGSKLIGATITPSNGKLWNLGAFVPTVVTPTRLEGIAVETFGGCGGPGFCGVVGLNIYKVVANGSIGTGPNFADSSKLGVPGFNEFFYLNQHPDVAAAVERGEYRNGLEHYLVEGRAKGYAMHAPKARDQR